MDNENELRIYIILSYIYQFMNTCIYNTRILHNMCLSHWNMICICITIFNQLELHVTFVYGFVYSSFVFVNFAFKFILKSSLRLSFNIYNFTQIRPRELFYDTQHHLST